MCVSDDAHLIFVLFLNPKALYEKRGTNRETLIRECLYIAEGVP